MKSACAAIVSLVLVAPALADQTKTVSQVTFSCEVTGSGNEGFSIYATNGSGSEQQETGQGERAHHIVHASDKQGDAKRL